MDTQFYKDLLHNRGLKATSSRLKLLHALNAYDSAMPYAAIQEVMADIDRVTLYRTLESLKEQGIIHKAFQENNETYYAICDKKCDTTHHHHDHVHFRCEKCQVVTCEEPVDDIQVLLPNLEIHKVSIHVEGICQTCLAKKVS